MKKIALLTAVEIASVMEKYADSLVILITIYNVIYLNLLKYSFLVFNNLSLIYFRAI